MFLQYMYLEWPFFQLTWADVAVAERVWSLSDPDDPLFTKTIWKEFMDPEERVRLLEDHPFLRDHADRVRAVPAIQKWLQERPSNAKERF